MTGRKADPDLLADAVYPDLLARRTHRKTSNVSVCVCLAFKAEGLIKIFFWGAGGAGSDTAGRYNGEDQN